MMIRSCSRAMRTRRCRQSSLATQLNGLCRVGMVYTARTFLRVHRCARASRSGSQPAEGMGASSRRWVSARTLKPG
ncbi:hypothetical protein D3C81_2174580 [compost metagenome]